MLRFFPWRESSSLAFDLGTANIRVMSSQDGLLFDEPSICCFQRNDRSGKLVAAGIEARPMADRAPARLRVERPLCRGVLQDIDAARALLRFAGDRVRSRGRASTRPTLIGVPADATQAEQRALLTAARDAQLGPIQLVSEPIAAAIGAGLPIAEPQGCMLIECGAGTTEVVVISLGHFCVRRTVRVGGASLDQAIADHLHFRHRFLIGEQTAERIKLQLAEAQSSPAIAQGMIEIRGRSLETGGPGILALPAATFDEVVRKHFTLIIEAVADTLNNTPPELSHDIYERGVTLTGGSAPFPLLAQMITDATGLRATVADEPHHCVAKGLQKMLQN